MTHRCRDTHQGPNGLCMCVSVKPDQLNPCSIRHSVRPLYSFFSLNSSLSFTVWVSLSPFCHSPSSVFLRYFPHQFSLPLSARSLHWTAFSSPKKISCLYFSIMFPGPCVLHTKPHVLTSVGSVRKLDSHIWPWTPQLVDTSRCQNFQPNSFVLKLRTNTITSCNWSQMLELVYFHLDGSLQPQHAG